MIGSTISHYRIIEQLGQGGMGVVYKAEDTRLHRPVALKFLPPQMSGNEDAKQRFMQEARAASALDHANICSIFDIGEAPVPGADGTQLFIVMAFYDGETLKYRLQEGALPIEQCVSIASQLAAGLQRAHEAGIVHRDMKPANIMVTDRGEVKILDFGVAKLAGGLELTQTGSTLGTAAYMSPEQARSEPVDNRTDLWSLGIILYEMLAGRRPFEGDYDAAVAYAILNEDQEPVRNHRPEVPDGVAAVVARLLRKNRDDRFQSAAEVLAALGVEQTARVSDKRVGSVPDARPKKIAPLLWRIGAAAVVVVALVLGLRSFLGDRESPSSGATEVEMATPRTIAVLPFADHSPAQDNEYVADGITEELIYGLGKIKGLRVAARSSAFYFKGRSDDISSIAEQLNVGLILDGSIRRDGDALRVTAELVNAADGFQLWSERYDRRIEDMLAVQDDITRSIVNALEIELSGEESARLTEHGTQNLDAYTFYLRARQQWNLRSEEGLAASIDLFRQAIDLDPGYARAYAGLADAYSISADWGYLLPKDGFERSREAAEKAIELDPELAEGYVALALVKGQFDRGLKSASSLFEKALELDPDYATGHQWFGELLIGLGEYAGAEDEMERALELDPLSPIINASQALPHLSSRNYEAAERAAIRALDLFPDFQISRLFLAIADFGSGDMERARGQVQQCTRQEDCLGLLGMLDGIDGRAAEAQAILEELRATDVEDRNSLYIAWVYTGLGDLDAAFNELEKASTVGYSYLYLLDWPIYDPIRDDPRFIDIQRRLGFR